jgi:hypothetical protein
MSFPGLAVSTRAQSPGGDTIISAGYLPGACDEVPFFEIRNTKETAHFQ